MEVAEIVAVAESVHARPLRLDTVLRGSPRTTVLRCRDQDGTVVVKQFATTRTVANSGGYGFAREWAGLQTVAGAPQLLATSTEHALLVMEDVGLSPTLADLLLGIDPDTARTATLEWARTVGRTVAAGAEASVRTRFADLITERDPRTRSRGGPPSPELPRAAVDRLAGHGIVVPDSVAAELSRLARLAADEASCLSPGDFCPDNAVVEGDRVRLVDLEGAAVHHPALAAAYLVMPLSTCWCLADFGEGFTSLLWQEFRTAASALDQVWDSPTWTEDLQLACASHVLAMTELSLGGLVAGDIPLAPASGRQRLAARWRWAGEHLTTLPGIAELCRRALHHFGWPSELPLYPAFAET